VNVETCCSVVAQARQAMDVNEEAVYQATRYLTQSGPFLPLAIVNRNMPSAFIRKCLFP
jgi:hypothetical protein